MSADLCDSATLMGEFEMKLTAGVGGIVNEAFDLSPEALEAIAANDVTICIEITSDFDGDITIGEYYFAFGGGAAGNQPHDSGIFSDTKSSTPHIPGVGTAVGFAHPI